MLRLCALLLVILSFKSMATDAKYYLTWQNSKQILDIKACFESDSYLRLSNQNRELSSSLLTAIQADENVKNADNSIRFAPTSGKCLAYQISLNSKGRWPYLFENKSLVLPTPLWFWSNDSIATSEFHVYDEKGTPIHYHFPWPVTDNVYQTNATSRAWSSRTLIGDLSTNSLDFNNGRQLTVTLLGSTQAREKEWLNWLHQTGRAIETAFGQLPLPQANILLMPANSGRSAVPWGEVQRSGLPSVHFFINTQRPFKDFQQDWTASHELSHLFVPKISWRDRWLSEGIASYYQNILRARAGILTRDEAWQKLREGFARGRRDFNGRSLRQVNKTMHLYWGGVAIYFLADLKLREQGKSLDAVLQQFSACCLPSNHTWRAESFMQKLDALSDTQVFTELLENQAAKKQFPVSKTFEQNSNPLLLRHLNAILTKP